MLEHCQGRRRPARTHFANEDRFHVQFVSRGTGSRRFLIQRAISAACYRADMRVVLIVSAALLLYPGRDASFAGVGLSFANAVGFVLLVIVVVRQFGRKETVS